MARSAASIARAREGGAASVRASVDELPEVAGAVVATPTTSHAEVVEALLERGLPVFVEKPMTPDPMTARRLVDIGEGRLFVMDKWRYHPGIEELARVARSGELGRVMGLRTTRTGWGHDYADVDAIWILAPHDLTIALEVLGHIPPARQAVVERVGATVSGMIALLGDDPWVALEASVTAVRRVREVRLLCEGGVAWLGDSYEDHIGVAVAGAPEGEIELRPIATELPLLRELRAFVAFVQGGPEPRSSASEGLAVVERISELRQLAGAGSGLT